MERLSGVLLDFQEQRYR